ncbi:MAG: hypothetical protein Q8L27_01655, partial [archaeon]|nr:hypothetical protein [archaeon]
MKSRCLLVSLILLFSIISISALTVDTEFQKLANYAAEYETGNINYVQLLLYTSAVRENLNEILGVVSQDNGGIVKENQIQSILGTPTEQTNWVWSEGANKEMRLDKDVSVWRKIVFDGRKIQIRLNAQPSIFSKGNNNQDNSNSQSELEGRLVYRLNFETEFKKPENQLNIEGKINEIKTLAQSFSSDPSSANAENLAKESVSAERIFESYFKQAGGKCEDVMSQVFGSENKKTSQNMFVKEISFCEGDNYDVIARLEMCDDCEWNWISVNFDIRGRGPGFKPVQNSDNSLSMDNYKTKSATELQSEVTSLITQAITSCQNKDISSLMAIQNKLKMANEAWNQKSNDLWQEVNKIYETQNQAMSQEERMRFDQSYGWIKQEQEKRQKIKELTKASYETRKQFYINLFSSYESKDSYYTQIEYQKTLFEDFKQVGQEICDNNVDDNKDNAIDCADSQCGGKICGKGTSTTSNSTEQVDFYCIQSTCQAKQEMKTIEIVTSNNTLACPEVPVITCEEGSKVFFSKYDTETNCPLESSCLKETTSCSVNEDCSQPACGFAECIQGSCQVTSLTECRPPECTDGEERICDSSGIITEICTDGFWEKTGECTTVTEIKEEPIGGNECLTAGDCGADSVCNNGFCQSLPQVILVPVEESTTGEVIQETQNTETSNPELEIRQETGTTQETNPAETQQESAQTKEVPQTTSEPIPTISGAAILEFFEPLISKIKILGLAITGYEGEAPLETPVET